jgi:hypothetical protein
MQTMINTGFDNHNVVDANNLNKEDLMIPIKNCNRTFCSKPLFITSNFRTLRVLNTQSISAILLLVILFTQSC